MTKPDKPVKCRFCGREAHGTIYYKLAAYMGDGPHPNNRFIEKVFFYCSDIQNCGATGPYRKTEDEAIEAWNLLMEETHNDK